jgi:hypothetical protein
VVRVVEALNVLCAKNTLFFVQKMDMEAVEAVAQILMAYLIRKINYE